MRSYLFALAFSCAVSFTLTALFDIHPLASVVLAVITFGLCAGALWLYRGGRKRRRHAGRRVRAWCQHGGLTLPEVFA